MASIVPDLTGHRRAFGPYKSDDEPHGPDWPLPNVWIGISAEDQPRADERIPDLIATPAAIRFISLEPLLAPVDITRYLEGGHYYCDEGSDIDPSPTHRCRTSIDWVIAGAESGPDARPCDLDWVRSLRDQCTRAGVAFFWKQHVTRGRKISMPHLDGRQWIEFPR